MSRNICKLHHKLRKAKTGVGTTFTWSNEVGYINIQSESFHSIENKKKKMLNSIYEGIEAPGPAKLAGTRRNLSMRFSMGTGKSKKLSRCSGREREIKETVPVVWDGSGKYKKSF